MTQKEALKILQTGANVFLTGSPGSGKTHTVRSYVDWLRAHSIEPAITASTGVAATHIHGQTLHAWSGIGILDRFTAYDIDRIASKEHVAKRIQKTSVLIIDEISMLPAPVLDAVDAICRQVRATDRPFGGIQVVLVGDFFQLPPISKASTAAQFAFQSEAWHWLNLIICYLTEQHRQDDRTFLSLLGAIRSGSFAEDEAEILQDRFTTLDKIGSDIPRLYTHNADVDRLNDTHLAALPGNAHVYEMESQGKANLVEGLKRGCLSPERLVLKEGAVVMCTKNNAGLAYANGTLGRVVGFEAEDDYPIIETLDGRQIMISPSEWVVDEEGKIRAKIVQIPLRLAWAITIHKSQGQSLDAAAMDLSRAFEYGQGYVALSRVRSLEGLHLLGWSAQAVAVHPQIAEKDWEFQEASDTAAELFDELESFGERKKMEKNFILAAGGTVEEVAEEVKPRKMAPKQTTYDETLMYLKEGKTIEEVADIRGLGFGTIVEHAERLVAGGRLATAELEALMPDELRTRLVPVAEAFQTLGFEKLSPVYSHLDEEYSYDELKLARAYLRQVL
jgi:ATP-dependent DNA helicase PIF1